MPGHLVTDVAATGLAGQLTFALVHFGFHATHLDGFPAADAVAQTLGLGVQVAMPAGVLIALVRGVRLTPRVSGGWPGGA